MGKVSDFLDGRTLFVTGATGFLAKGLVEKVLRYAPDVSRIYLLIRPTRQSDGSEIGADQRLEQEIIRSSAFTSSARRHGNDLSDLARRKLVAVAGDLTRERLGIEPKLYERLCDEVDIVINSAATVVFDERVDMALELNTLGPHRLLGFAKECRDAIFIHVSTAYVNGQRIGNVPEAALPTDRCIRQLVGNGDGPSYDLDTEIASIRGLRDEVEKESRSEQLTRQFVRMLDRQDRGKRVTRVRREHQLDALRKRWITKRLIDDGIRRARELGWHDNYTYTKAMGEQLIVRDRGDLPTVIVRPSIIESSLFEPEPGWLDGLKVADPIIAHYAKGRLSNFPGRPEVVLDVIPVDMVVNAILGALPEARRGDDVQIYHVATGSENPFTLGGIFDLTYQYFKANPMRERDGTPIVVENWSFPSVAAFRRRFKLRHQYPLKALSWAIDHVRFVPWPDHLRRRVALLDAMFDRVLSLVEIYSPYITLDCRFGTQNTHGLFERLDPEERNSLNFDVSCIDWRRYIRDIHLPGLIRHVLKIPNAQPQSLGLVETPNNVAGADG